MIEANKNTITNNQDSALSRVSQACWLFTLYAFGSDRKGNDREM